MKKVVSFLLLIIVFSILVSSKGIAYEMERTEEKTFDLQMGAKLQLYLNIGDIDIHTWAKEKVHISLRKWVRADNENDAEEKMKNLEVDYKSQRGILEIHQLKRKNNNYFSNLLKHVGIADNNSTRLDFTIYVPKQLSLQINQHKGRCNVSSLTGDLVLEQEKGHLKLDSLSANKLDLRLGEVQADIFCLEGKVNPGAHVVISTDEGRLTLKDCKIGKLVARLGQADGYFVGNRIADCQVETNSGNVFVRPLFVSGDQYRITSKKGDVYLIISKSPPCSMFLETGLGFIKTPYSWNIKSRGAGFSYHSGKEDASRGAIEIISELGDIFIQKNWQAMNP